MDRAGECGGRCGRGKAAHAGAGAVAGFLGCLLLVWAIGGCGKLWGCGEVARDGVEEVAAQFNLSTSKLQALASLLSSPEKEWICKSVMINDENPANSMLDISNTCIENKQSGGKQNCLENVILRDCCTIKDYEKSNHENKLLQNAIHQEIGSPTTVCNQNNVLSCNHGMMFGLSASFGILVISVVITICKRGKQSNKLCQHEKLLQTPSAKMSRKWSKRALLIGVLVGLCSSVWIFSSMYADVVARRIENLANVCDERARMLQDQFNVSMNHVHALAILVSTFHHGKNPSAIDQPLEPPFDPLPELCIPFLCPSSMARNAAPSMAMDPRFLQRQMAAAAAATATNTSEARGARNLRPASERFRDQTMELGPSACTDASIEQATRSRLNPETPARRPGREATPQPREGEVVVFEAFFDAGLGFPASELLAGVLDAFHLELLQLSPNAVARLAIFEWAMRAEGCEGRAEVFAEMHEALCQPKKKGGRVLAFGSINFQLRRRYADSFPAKATNERWYSKWVNRWFYVRVGLASGLAGIPRHIWFRREARIEANAGTISARVQLLQIAARRMSMRDLAEEFVALEISPLKVEWPASLRSSRDESIPSELSRRLGSLVARTPEEVTRLAERILGVPTAAERARRLELVGSWERFNRVWGALELTPPPLPEGEVLRDVSKRKASDADSGLSPGRSKKKRIVRGPKQMSPGPSSASHSEGGASSEGAQSESGDPLAIPVLVPPIRPDAGRNEDAPPHANPAEPAPEVGQGARAVEATPRPGAASPPVLAPAGGSAGSFESRATDSLDRGGLDDPLGAIEKSADKEAELAAAVASSPPNSIDNLFYRPSPLAHLQPREYPDDAADADTPAGGVEHVAPYPADAPDARSGAPVNARRSLGSRDEADSRSIERVPQESAGDAEVRPRPPTDRRAARGSMPLLRPFLADGEDFALKVAPVHDCYLRLRETPVIGELGLSDGLDLGRAIEMAAGQVMALAQGQLSALLAERQQHEAYAAELATRVANAERLVRERSSEAEALRLQASRIEALEAQVAEVGSLRARVAELDGLRARAARADELEAEVHALRTRAAEAEVLRSRAAEAERLEGEVSRLLAQASEASAKVEALEARVTQLEGVEVGLNARNGEIAEELAEAGKTAADAAESLRKMLARYGTGCGTFDIAREPLVRRVKFIRSAIRQIHLAMAQYDEVSARVAAYGILRHLEASGLPLPSSSSQHPVTFEGDHLRTPSPAVTQSWRALRAAWQTEGPAAIQAWLEEALRARGPAAPSKPLTSARLPDPQV
ncbi:hypothetical protein GUJ93_ZPchr0010g10569 [Zizania palustris]|uniref:Transposase (putative) gypsy type domain-containing protein n=1 Tax=Zizania palustris TaxID=103762 RepID=A0A8J5WFV6_ZIZPA|nr:hypothetical protein GUJ93_ZPchr0010g10569 [Zizania palustris]